jgi:hypothetical protein
VISAKMQRFVERVTGEPMRVPVGKGPGTELTRLLAAHGITEEPGCKCRVRAIEMDQSGPDWCEANIETIVGWMKEEADRRGLPFVAFYARWLVRRAIKAARQ